MPFFHEDSTAIPWCNRNPQRNGMNILTVASNLFFDEQVVMMTMMIINIILAAILLYVGQILY